MIATVALTWVLIVYRDGAVAVPMKSREACVAAGQKIYAKTRMFSACVNQETGEVEVPR
jgi:hypothetical protein